ncbi:MAG TPA: AEC family transporter [Thermodesulfovibrionales bacterium]|nr:AEC family transporter [Thermodesulfovibrionales bacterium]
MLDILLPFGLIILAGVVFRFLRFGSIAPDLVRASINLLVLNMFLPALCLKIVYSASIDLQTTLIPLTAAATLLFTLVLSLGIYSFLEKKMPMKPSEKGALLIASAFGNTTYLGLPVLTGLYGPDAARYALFYDLLATTPILWLLGAPMASRYGEGKKMKLSESVRTIASLPPVWAILGGLVLRLMEIQLPAFLFKTLALLGDMVVPLMVFSIGLALIVPKVNHAFVIMPAVIMKLAVTPLIAYMTARSLGIRGEPLAACFLEGAMPVMVLSLLIAERFKLDLSLTSLIIVVTTALSFVTLPVAVYMTQFLIP